ncbi:MAG: hypothetical protein LBV04_02300 [Deferribacteraceae bacterium]|jgi:hypothetical protein|nr:hypothetical protein [Deferribacteraceae bacterium]
MSFDRYQYKVLCEDKRHFHFVAAFLKIKGANLHKIMPFKDVSDGRGAGTKFVDSLFDEVKQFSPTSRTVFIVVRDVDMADYQAVKSKFANESNNIFLVLPKRNIESWFYFLDHIDKPEALDETIDRKQQLSHKDIKPTTYAKVLCQLLDNPPANLPASLAENINQLQKRVALK